MKKINVKHKKMQKKAQVTVFIILGLFILVSVGIFTYFTSEIFKYKNLPEQFVPVAKYAEQCTEDVLLQGIFQAGMNGGYVYPQYEEKEAYLNAGFPVPYWYLAGQDRSVTLAKLEADLSTYLEQNINNCLNNFAAFDDEFDFAKIPEQNTTAKIEVQQNTVMIDIDLATQVGDGATTTTLPTIKVEVENSIGNKLFLAYQIMKTENEEGFLEFYTDEIIAASDWLPYEGLDFTCAPKRWKINDMKSYIQQAVTTNIQFIMFEGTSYEETGDLYYDNIYKVDVGAGDVDTLKVETTYNPSWDMSLDVQPNINGIVTDIKMVGPTIAIPCIHVYHHKYTTEFPILFEITDEESSEYPFFFATPVIMRRNEPDRERTMQPWPSEIDAVRSKAYCSNTTTATAYLQSEDGTISTEETTVDNWLYTLDIVAMDSVYGFDEILNNVSISYQCVQFLCDVGATMYGSGESLVGYPLLSSPFPTCANGQIIAEKEGYHTTKMFQTVSQDTDGGTILLPMYRVQPLDYAITVIQNHNNVITERAMEEGELAVITLKNEANEFERVMVREASADEETPEQEVGFDNFELLVGDDITYAVDIKLMKDDRFIGSYVYNWTPTANAVSGSMRVQLYVPVKDVLVPTDENYLEAIQWAESASQEYAPILS